MLDLVTVMIISFVMYGLCALALFSLWRETNMRYPETFYLMLGMVLLASGYLLQMLRGVIPLNIAIIFGNPPVVAGMLTLSYGLFRLQGIKVRKTYLVLLVAIFTIIHVYFTFITPFLLARSFNLAVFLLISFILGMVAGFIKKSDEKPNFAFITGILFGISAFIGTVRILTYIFLPLNVDTRFNLPGGGDNIYLALYLVIICSICYTLTLLVSNRLRITLDESDKKYTLELEKSEAKYRNLVENTNDIIYSLTTDGFFTYVSPAWARLLGHDPNEVEGHSYQEVIHPDDLPIFDAFLQKVIESGERQGGFEYRLRHKYGQWHWYITSASPIRDTSGRICGFDGIGLDITARKQAEEGLRIFMDSVENSSDAVGMSTPEGKHYYQNKAFSRLFGEVGEYPPDTLYIDKKVGEDIFRAIMSGASWTGEVAMYGADRQVKEILLRAFSTRDEKGNITALIGIHTDITARKRAEEALRTSEERYRSLFTQMLDGIYRSTPAGKFVEINPAMVRMFGYANQEEILGIDITTELYFDPAERASQLLESGERGIEVYRMRRKDGSEIWVEDHGYHVRDEQGHIIFHEGILRDVTEKVQAEQRILQWNADLERRVQERTAQLEEINRELESFSYSISHDLRAPLRAINGFSHIIVEDYAGQLPEEALGLLNQVIANTGRMGTLIDDLLKFSRLGRQPLVKQTVEMSALAQNVVEMLHHEIEASQSQISIQPLPSCQGDPSLLIQVWLNLLSNALKYSQKRKNAQIEIGCLSIEGQEPAYYVKDNGVGFDMQYADKLFGVFQRLHRESEFEGTGVGLAIVQRIITRHGGRIWAESAPDEGAIFYFTIGAGSYENRRGG